MCFKLSDELCMQSIVYKRKRRRGVFAQIESAAFRSDVNAIGVQR